MPAVLDNILPFAHDLWARCLPAGGRALDATAGNGRDTLRLAELAGPTGTVYAFDIQTAALQHTRDRLTAAAQPTRLHLIRAGHQNLRRYVPNGLHLAVFNCGYLPGGDKNLTTRTADTLAALDAVLPLLRPHGLVSIALYPGHPEGRREAAAVQAWAAGLPQTQYAVLHYGFTNRRNHPPFLLAVEKLPPVSSAAHLVRL